MVGLRILYKLVTEALMLTVALACGYLAAELILPGFLSERVSLFSVVGVVLSLVVVWIGLSRYLGYTEEQSLKIPRTWVFGLTLVMMLVVGATFEKLEAGMMIFAFFATAMTIVLVWMISLHDLDDSVPYEEK